MGTSEEWLSKYVHEGLDKWPNENILRDLLRKYSNKEDMIIYRGLNFISKEDYENFINKLRENNFILQTNGISSWSNNKETAKQFSVTQPTYFILSNPALFKRENEKTQNKERLSGYRGVILETKIKANTAIDVRRSRSGAEEEIILLKGSYKVKVVDIKTYKDMIADNDVAINKFISKYDGKNNKELFDYIKHHHIHDLDDKSKRKIFKLFTKDTTIHMYEDEKYDWDTNNRMPIQKMNFHFSLYELLENENLILEEDKKRLYRKLSIEIRKAINFIAKNLNLNYDESLKNIRWVAEKVGLEQQFLSVVKKFISIRYRKLQDKTFEINQIKDHYEKRKAIESVTKQLKELLEII